MAGDLKLLTGARSKKLSIRKSISSAYLIRVQNQDGAPQENG
jgi:hypothetical protein